MATVKKKAATATEAKTKTASWNKLTGEMNIFAKTFGEGENERVACSVTVGKKNENGEYDNVYIPVYFSQDLSKTIELDEGRNILDVKNAFLTITKAKDGTFKLAIMVTEATVNESEIPF